MTFSFRLPFRVPQHMDISAAEGHPLRKTQSEEVWLTRVRDTASGEATLWSARGAGYGTPEQALEAGDACRDLLSQSFARLLLAADFGDDRAQNGRFTDETLAKTAKETGRVVSPDRYGVEVFLTDSEPLRIGLSATVSFGPNEQQFRDVVGQADEQLTRMSRAERLAFDLYSGSFFQPTTKTQFLMLMMAVEALMVPQPRDQEAHELVQQLIDTTKSSGVTDSDRQSILGGLHGMRRESIGQAGRSLAKTLEPRKYGGQESVKFFGQSYETRSALVHGNGSAQADEAANLVGPLTRFVADLLTRRHTDERS